MVSLSNIQNKLLVKVFNKLGSQVTVSYIQSTTDKWGDTSASTSSSSTYTAVPFFDRFSVKTFNPFGVLKDGQVDMLFKHDDAIAVGNTVSFNSVTYDVFGVERYPLQDGNIAQLARLVQSL